jgi:hypothetical protein
VTWAQTHGRVQPAQIVAFQFELPWVLPVVQLHDYHFVAVEVHTHVRVVVEVDPQLLVAGVQSDIQRYRPAARLVREIHGL